MVPASELPVWHAYFEREPWGFYGADRIASKSTLQLSAALGKMKPGTGVYDLMFKDRFESGDLDQEEFDQLSEEEQQIYIQRQIQRTKTVLN